MNEMLILKIIFSLLISTFIIALLLIDYFIFYKTFSYRKKCVEKTQGTVKRYAQREYGEGVHPPLVVYNVNGKEYKVVGPKLRGSIIKSIMTPLSSNKNIEWYIDDKKIIHITRTNNSLIKTFNNPYEEMYPKGSLVNVYYNPQNPKLAYVEWYYEEKLFFWIIIGIVIILAIILLLLIIFL